MVTYVILLAEKPSGIVTMLIEKTMFVKEGSDPNYYYDASFSPATKIGEVTMEGDTSKLDDIYRSD